MESRVQLLLRGLVAQARLAPHQRLKVLVSTTQAHTETALPSLRFYLVFEITPREVDV